MVVDAAPPSDYSPVGVFTLAANGASAAAATADRRQSNFLSYCHDRVYREPLLNVCRLDRANDLPEKCCGFRGGEKNNWNECKKSRYSAGRTRE